MCGTDGFLSWEAKGTAYEQLHVMAKIWSGLIRRRKSNPHLIAGGSRAPPSRGHHCPLCWGMKGCHQLSAPSPGGSLVLEAGVPLGCCCSEESRRSLIHKHIHAPSFVHVSIHAYVDSPNPSLGNSSVSFARGFLCLFKSCCDGSDLSDDQF